MTMTTPKAAQQPVLSKTKMLKLFLGTQEVSRGSNLLELKYILSCGKYPVVEQASVPPAHSWPTQGKAIS